MIVAIKHHIVMVYMSNKTLQWTRKSRAIEIGCYRRKDGTR